MAWGDPDRIPLTVYDWMLPRGMTERHLREAGVGLIVRLPGHRVQHREVEIVSREYHESGRRLIRRTIRTPVGEVWQVLEPDPAYETSNWIHEHFIKGPDDYRVLECYYRDMVFRDNFEAIREAQRRVGANGIVLLRIAKSPVQEMLYQMMGLEQFAFDYQERRDLFDSLHATMATRYEELYEFAAESPAEILQLGDNIYSDVVGRERFQRYLMPEYAKIMARITGTGKAPRGPHGRQPEVAPGGYRRRPLRHRRGHHAAADGRRVTPGSAGVLARQGPLDQFHEPDAPGAAGGHRGPHPSPRGGGRHETWLRDQHHRGRAGRRPREESGGDCAGLAGLLTGC